MKKIYILLSSTGTLPARLIRKFKGSTYSHTALSLAPATDCLYSYARKYTYNLFVAGFTVENIHTQVYARYPDAPCAVYSFELSETAYEKICEEIERYRENRKKAKYNFFAFLTFGLGNRLKRKFKHTCSQFVALLLARCGEVTLPKDPYLMLPDDFMNIDGATLVYSGLLGKCRIPAATEA